MIHVLAIIISIWIFTTKPIKSCAIGVCIMNCIHIILTIPPSEEVEKMLIFNILGAIILIVRSIYYSKGGRS